MQPDHQSSPKLAKRGLSALSGALLGAFIGLLFGKFALGLIFGLLAGLMFGSVKGNAPAADDTRPPESEKKD